MPPTVRRYCRFKRHSSEFAASALSLSDTLWQELNCGPAIDETIAPPCSHKGWPVHRGLRCFFGLKLLVIAQIVGGASTAISAMVVLAADSLYSTPSTDP